MVKQKRLKNGLKISVFPLKGTKTATVLVMVKTGSKYENKKTSGLSHFLEHMMFKGTKKRPTSMSIVSELDSMGAEYNAFTSKEYTGYWIKVEAKKISKAIDIISDVYLNSKLEQEEIDKERGVIIEEINMYEDNPMMYIDEVFEALLYGDCPAGWDTAGSKKSVMGLNKDEFVDYMQKQYGPKNTNVLVAGSIDSKKIKTLIDNKFSKKAFNSRGEGYIRKELVQEKQIAPQVKTRFKNTDQAHMILGVRTYPYGYKEEVALKVLATILGGSMSSRLFMNLRERNGLCYYVRTMSELYSDYGYMATQAGVPVDKIDKAIKITLDEYKKVSTELVSKNELKKVQDLLRGKYALNLESSDNVANWYARQAVMIDSINEVKKQNKKYRFVQNKLITPDLFLKEIDKVTSAQIKTLAKKIFVNKGLNFAVIGPYKNTVKFRKLVKF